MTTQEIVAELIAEVIELCEDDELDPHTFRDELRRLELQATLDIEKINITL